MQNTVLSGGGVAVITGAALGIGRAMAHRFVADGMRVALLDVDAAGLSEAAASLGDRAITCVTDVSDADALAAARARIRDRWDEAPAVLVNNAVTRLGRGMDAPLEDWRRALDINIMGVVNGVQTFLPDMQAAGAPGLIVNVGSKQGITNPPGHTVYNMAKAAVRTYTECLEHDLRQIAGRPVQAHLLVPGWTTTGTSEHKPGAWLPEQTVDYMISALKRGSFYIICPDDEVSTDEDKARIAWAAGDILEDRPPLSRWHPDWARVYREA